MLSSFLGMMNNKDQSLFLVGDMLRELFDMCECCRSVTTEDSDCEDQQKKVRNQRFLYSCQHFDHFEPDGEGPKRKVCPHSVQKCSRLDLVEIGALAIDRSPRLHLPKKS